MTTTHVDKVSAFVTSRKNGAASLLLFRHPNAGIQIPAGTVDEGEDVEMAVRREVAEETGLSDVHVVTKIGWRDELPPGVDRIITRQTKVHARPNANSIDWAAFRRGIGVRFLREENGFAQVSYEEGDRYRNPNYISYQITGWVPLDALAAANRRHFFHLTFSGDSPECWCINTDGHTFQPFWAQFEALPEIIAPQRAWLDFVMSELGYRFT
jgi:8-oxo-dGTP pyrophosphatase MutT (NUDIX family)